MAERPQASYSCRRHCGLRVRRKNRPQVLEGEELLGGAVGGVRIPEDSSRLRPLRNRCLYLGSFVWRFQWPVPSYHKHEPTTSPSAGKRLPRARPNPFLPARAAGPPGVQCGEVQGHLQEREAVPDLLWAGVPEEGWPGGHPLLPAPRGPRTQAILPQQGLTVHLNCFFFHLKTQVKFQ